MLSKSWEIPHPHELTMPSSTIKIPHIAPHRPGVGGGGGGVGVLIDKCIKAWGNIVLDNYSNFDPFQLLNMQAGVSNQVARVLGIYERI